MKAHRMVLQMQGVDAPLTREEVDLAPPGPGQVLVELRAIGVNFIDINQREGRVPLPLPGGLGHEAAGIVIEVGAGVEAFKVSDRVAMATAGPGAYASHRVVAADKLVPVPAGVDECNAAALLFKGLTAQYLVRKTHRVQAGDVVVVHAAAGGVGRLLLQWCRSLGAQTLAVTSSEAKLPLLQEAGASAVALLGRDDLRQTLLDRFGRLAHVVYDSVGLSSWQGSLDALAPFGMFVVYGGASGSCPPIDPELLNKKGCLFMTRPSVFPHNSTAELLRANAADLFQALAAGHLAVPPVARYPLADAAAALDDMKQKATSGALVLVP
jgi:NADPH2:quinone reductase